MKLFTIESDEIFAIDEKDLTPARLADIANWQIVIYQVIYNEIEEVASIEKYNPDKHNFTLVDTYDFGEAEEEIQKTRRALLG